MPFKPMFPIREAPRFVTAVKGLKGPLNHLESRVLSPYGGIELRLTASIDPRRLDLRDTIRLGFGCGLGLGAVPEIQDHVANDASNRPEAQRGRFWHET